MSQNSEVSAAFRNPPSMAETFKNSFANSPAAQTEVTNAVNADVVQSASLSDPFQVTVPPARQVNHILPPPRKAQDATPPQAVTPPPAKETAEDQQQAPVPTPQSPYISDAALRRQLEDERRLWAQEREQWRQAVQQQSAQLQDAWTVRQEYDRLKQQDELAQQLASDDAFADMTVDANDARRIIQLAAKTLQAPLDSMKSELAKQQQALAEQQRYLDSQIYQMRQQRSSARLQEAHPDFAVLARDPAFIQFAQQREGHTSKTREQVAWEEFNAGNPEYVINLVNEFKGQAPKVEQVRTVPPAQSAQTVTQTTQTPAAPQFTLAELNSLVQMGRITPDQYRDYLSQIRSAQKNPQAY